MPVLWFRQGFPNDFSTCPLLLQIFLEQVGWSLSPLWHWVIHFSGNKTWGLPDRGAPSMFDGPLSLLLLTSPAPIQFILHVLYYKHTHTQFILHVLSCKNRCKVLSYNRLNQPYLFLTSIHGDFHSLANHKQKNINVQKQDLVYQLQAQCFGLSSYFIINLFLWH